MVELIHNKNLILFKKIGKVNKGSFEKKIINVIEVCN
jgi:hypothetical protein